MYNSSGVADYRYKYFYDNSGNLVNWYINNNDNTETYENHTYTYGNTSWADLLTAFDGYGIAYEGQTYNSTTNTVTGTAKSGNPISYYNGTRWTFGWSNGRQLTSASKTGTSVSYTYDLNGIRTSKTVGTKTYSYLYASGKLLQQTDGTNTWNFAYAANGNPFSLTYNGTTYYYITNQMGDVMYLVNATGTRVAAYTYDPYGKVLTATGTMASINPLRYRGYYYDTETGFYYLKSRYYDPLICRFINADCYAATGDGLLGNNMFAYCGNDPVNRTDSSGNDWWHWAVAVAVVAVAAVAVVATAGGAAAAVVAVTSVANGVAFGTTATTVAAGAFVGGASALAMGTYAAAVESNSVEEFAEQGEAVMYATVGGSLTGAATAYKMANAQNVSDCFVAGTLICTEDGEIPIEDIHTGDLVWAWDEDTGEVSLKPVVETYINQTDELVHVFVNGEEIVTTPTHPFYVPKVGWTSATHLRAGDILVLVNGEYVVVEQIQHEILEAPVTIYNFQVQDAHTYYVSESGVLVHNKCETASLPKNGTTVDSSEALDMAEDFLGPGYTEVEPGRFVSADGARQVRMSNADLLGTHGGGCHINFNILVPKYKNAHVYFID